MMTPIDVANVKQNHGCSKLLKLHGGLPWPALARAARSRSRDSVVRVTSEPDIRIRRWVVTTVMGQNES